MITLYPTIREHVLESNAIEGIHDTHGPLVTSHIRAALFARMQDPDAPLRDPLEIHARLAEGTPMASFGGTYRTSAIWVGDKKMPHHEHIPMLIDQWFELVDGFLQREETPKDRVKLAYFLHTWFLCIHPFRDGNGRTARLILNTIRIKMGLPWKIVRSDTESQVTYRAWIHRIEELFKECNPDVYR